MANLERVGAELYLDNSQFISAVGQTERVTQGLEQSFRGIGDAVQDMGLKFDKTVVDAAKFGKLRDSAGAIKNGMIEVHKVIDLTSSKYQRLAESGRASHRALASELRSTVAAQDKYRAALVKVVEKTIASAEAGEKDLKAKQKVNTAVDAAKNAYKAYQKQIEKTAQAEEAVKRENNAIIASYKLLGNRLAQATSGVNQIKAAWAGLVSRLAPVRNALSSVRGALSGTSTGAATAGSSIGILGKFAGVAGVAIGALGVAVGAMGKAFSIVLSPIKKAIAGLKNFFKIASQIAVGILIRDTIRSLVRELRELAFAGFEAITFFQALEIRLDLMELRSLRAEGAVGSLTDMMAMASDRAIRLTHWLKELSLTSPFTIETLATTTSLNLAMGFTEDMSKRLTLAIAEYTAGMGLSNQVMERIVFNFGQMKSAGKVTGTEMRDLARGAFLPLADVLNEAARLMGVATDDIMEFRKAAAEGAVDVDTFFRAFINVVERDFAGASQRFSRTLTGLQNRLKNFVKTVIGLEILKPVFDRLAEIGSKALDSILQPELIGRARLLGLVLVRAFNGVYNTIVGRLVPSFRELWKTLGFGVVTFESIALAVAKFSIYLREGIRFVANILDKLTAYFTKTGVSLVDQMGQFGYNIIAFFAKGMVAGLHLVIKVLTWIGNAIAGLLGPGSPPKILPDLPKWGMSAMTEYLKGFTLADFDVLEGLQDPIKDALDILEETGKIGENQAGVIFANISKSIAKALSAGKVDEDLFAEIAAITGPFGEEIAQLARRQVELAAATEEVRKAEQRLEDARKAHSIARVRTNSLIREYNEELRAGADPAFLKAKLAEINASEKAAQAAYEEQKAAEADLEQKEKNLEIVSELLQLQEKLVDQLLELTKAQIIQPEQPETETGGAGDEVPGDEEGLPELPALPEIELPDEEAIRKKIGDIFAKANEEVKKRLAELKKTWEESGLGLAFADLGKAWESVKTSWNETILPIIERIGTWWTETGKPIKDEFVGFWAGIFSEDITNLIDSFSDSWDRITLAFEDVNKVLESSGIQFNLEGFLTVLLEIGLVIASLPLVAFHLLLVLIANIAGWVASGIENAKDALIDLGANFYWVQEAIDDIREFGLTWETAFELFNSLGETLGGIFEVATEFVIGFFADLWEDLKDWTKEVWDGLVGNSFFPDLVDKIIEIITGWKDDFIDLFDEAIAAVVGFLEDTFGPAWDWLQDEVLQPFIDWINNTFSVDIQGFIDGVLEDWRVFVEETIPTAWQTLQDKLGEVWGWIDEHIIAPIREWIDGPLEDLRAVIADTLTNAFNTFKTNVLDPVATGFDSVKSAVSGLFTWLGNLRDRVLAFPLKLLELISGSSPSPLSIGIDYATQSMKKMATQGLPQLNKQLVMMQSAGLTSAPLVSSPSVMPYGAGSSQSVNVNMGGVNISTPMDEAVFEQRVRNVVQKSLRG